MNLFFITILCIIILVIIIININRICHHDWKINKYNKKYLRNNIGLIDEYHEYDMECNKCGKNKRVVK